MEQSIIKVETELFGSAPAAESIQQRLDKIDTKLFGSPQSSGVITRLANIQNKMAVAPNTDVSTAEHEDAISSPTRPRSPVKYPETTPSAPSSLLRLEAPHLDSPDAKFDKKTPLHASTSFSELSEYGIDIAITVGDGKRRPIVSAVRPASRAAGWGVEVGDILNAVFATANGPQLQILRDGKLYSVNLTKDRLTTSIAAPGPAPKSVKDAPVLEPPKPQFNRMAGTFQGSLTGGSQITTEIKFSPAGVPFGTYSQQLSDGYYSGSLTDGHILGDSQLSFTWNDRFGFGTVNMSFTPDFNSFTGDWTSSNRNFPMQWSEVRQ